MEKNRKNCEEILMMEDSAPEKIRHLLQCSSCRTFVEECRKYSSLVKKVQEDLPGGRELGSVDMKILSHAAFAIEKRAEKKAVFRKYMKVAACVALLFAGTLCFYGSMEFSGKKQQYAGRIEQKKYGTERQENTFSGEDGYLVDNIDTLTSELIYLSAQLDAAAISATLDSYQS